jgi:Uma2 family endonuclease
MIAASNPTPRRFTVAEYHRMAEAGILDGDARLELLDGIIVSMMPVGPRHASTVDRIAEVLFRAFSGRACVRVQNPVTLSDWSEPEPDLAVAQGKCVDYAESHPRPSDILFVVEVAETSAKYDREEKLPLYARAGIREAWLVDVSQRRIEVHTRASPDGFLNIAIHHLEEEITPEAAPDIRFRIADVLS